VRYLKDKYGRQVDHTDMYIALGFNPKRNIPKEYEAVHDVDGIRIYVMPSRGGSKHRIFYACTCDRLIPFGRIGQHLKAHR
jgi:hypothetical protein